MISEAEFVAGFEEMCALGAGLLHLTVYHRDGLLNRLLAAPEHVELHYDMMAMDRYITAIGKGEAYHCLFCEHPFRRGDAQEPAALGVLRASADAALNSGRNDMPVLVQGVCQHCAEQRTGKLVQAMAEFFRGSLLPNARLVQPSELHPAGRA